MIKDAKNILNMTITQFNLLSFKPVVPLFSIYYSFLNIRPPKLVLKRLSDTATYIDIYISRKTLRSLRPEIGEFAGQERTGHRAGKYSAGQVMAEGQIKSGRAKVEQSVGKKQGMALWALCIINKQLCRAGPKRTASKNGSK